MRVEHFIAKRMAFTNSASFTKIIIRIAIAAIAVSLTVMILTTAIITGFKKEITDKIFGFWGHIHITDSNINRNFELTPIDKTAKYYDQIREIDNLEYQAEAEIFGFKIPDKVTDKVTFGGVKGVHPNIILPGLLSTRDNFHGVLLKGVDAAYDWEKMQEFIVDGLPISYKKDSTSSDLLISKNIAERLHIYTGDKVVLNFIIEKSQIKKRFVVCGIYNTGLEEYDKRFGIVDIAKVQEILGWPASDVQGMEVVLDDVRDLDIISEYIYYEVLPQEYFAETIRSKFPSIFEWLNLQDINEKIILQLMIIVAIINMITVLLILILERTQMIGILKSIGARDGSIRQVFLWFAMFITIGGILIGNILGLGLAWLQNEYRFIKLDEADYYLDYAPVMVLPWHLMVINIGAFVLIGLCLIAPSFLVSKINPIKTIHFQ